MSTHEVRRGAVRADGLVSQDDFTACPALEVNHRRSGVTTTTLMKWAVSVHVSSPTTPWNHSPYIPSPTHPTGQPTPLRGCTWYDEDDAGKTERSASVHERNNNATTNSLGIRPVLIPSSPPLRYPHPLSIENAPCTLGCDGDATPNKWAASAHDIPSQSCSGGDGTETSTDGGEQLAHSRKVESTPTDVSGALDEPTWIWTGGSSSTR